MTIYDAGVNASEYSGHRSRVATSLRGGDYTIDAPRESSVLSTSPSEDSGSATQDRYRWQHHCTTSDCFRLLDDSGVRRVVCEVHEDYVVESDNYTELVSCKHRELPKGPWSIKELCAQGGLAHLFCRFVKFSEEEVRVRLMTNGALRTGQLQAAAVMDACAKLADGAVVEGNLLKLRDELGRGLLYAGRQKNFQGIPVTPKPPNRAAEMALELPDPFVDQVTSFMRRLRIVSELPGRTYIEDIHLQKVAGPALRAAGYEDVAVDHCYGGLVDLVAERNRAMPLTGRYSAWMTDPGMGSARGVINALVEGRSIRRADVVATVELLPRRLLRRSGSATGHERLRVKLIAAGLGENRISAAIRKWEAWREAWTRYKVDLPGDDGEREDIEARVLDIVGDVEAEIGGAREGNGVQMYQMLRERLAASGLHLAGGMRLSTDELMGVVFDLVVSDEVWLSERFDVDAALAGADRVTRVGSN